MLVRSTVNHRRGRFRIPPRSFIASVTMESRPLWSQMASQERCRWPVARGYAYQDSSVHPGQNGLRAAHRGMGRRALPAAHSIELPGVCRGILARLWGALGNHIDGLLGGLGSRSPRGTSPTKGLIAEMPMKQWTGYRSHRPGQRHDAWAGFTDLLESWPRRITDSGGFGRKPGKCAPDGLEPSTSRL